MRQSRRDVWVGTDELNHDLRRCPLVDIVLAIQCARAHVRAFKTNSSLHLTVQEGSCSDLFDSPVNNNVLSETGYKNQS